MVRKYFLMMLLLLSFSLGFSLECFAWDWHRHYVSSFSCVEYNGKTYYTDVEIRPNGSTPPTHLDWKECVIVGESCVEVGSVVRSVVRDTIRDTIYVLVPDTSVGVIELFDTTRTSVDLFDTTRTQVNLYDTTRTQVNLYDTTRTQVDLFDTTRTSISLYDTIGVVEVYDTLVVTDTIYRVDTVSYSLVDSLYLVNSATIITGVDQPDPSKMPIVRVVIGTIDSLLLDSNRRYELVVTVMIYNNLGQYVDRRDFVEELPLGFVIQRYNFDIFRVDGLGRVVSETGRRLGTGAYLANILVVFRDIDTGRILDKTQSLNNIGHYRIGE